MDALVPNRSAIWRSDIARRRRTVRIPVTDFSILDDPDGALGILTQIARAECDAAAVEVDFLDPDIVDVGPFLVLGIMFERMAPLVTGGRVTQQTMKVLEAVNLRQFLRMRPFGAKLKFGDIWALPLERRRGSGTSTSENVAFEPSRAEIVADRTARHVDHWLSKIEPPSSLTTWGASKIKAFVGEILNNAERHGRTGGDGEWIAAGFMARREIKIEGEISTVHVCHLCFFNPGRPIAETITDSPATIRNQVDSYRRRHRGAGQHHETLATVFALQDGISRIDQGEGMPSGGTGLMDIVEFANEVGKTDLPELSAKVAIMSGRAYIRFAQPFARGLSSGDGEPRLQWFNADNDVMEPPAETHVKTLAKRFPGTLISLRFVLDGSVKARDA